MEKSKTKLISSVGSFRGDRYIGDKYITNIIDIGQLECITIRSSVINNHFDYFKLDEINCHIYPHNYNGDNTTDLNNFSKSNVIEKLYDLLRLFTHMKKIRTNELHMCYENSDTRPMIPREQIIKIFEPFEDLEELEMIDCMSDDLIFDIIKNKKNLKKIHITCITSESGLRRVYSYCKRKNIEFVLKDTNQYYMVNGIMNSYDANYLNNIEFDKVK